MWGDWNYEVTVVRGFNRLQASSSCATKLTFTYSHRYGRMPSLRQSVVRTRCWRRKRRIGMTLKLRIHTAVCCPSVAITPKHSTCFSYHAHEAAGMHGTALSRTTTTLSQTTASTLPLTLSHTTTLRRAPLGQGYEGHDFAFHHGDD
jgi:hypothetical protein